MGYMKIPNLYKEKEIMGKAHGVLCYGKNSWYKHKYSISPR